jgi:hypothetical protein
LAVAATAILAAGPAARGSTPHAVDRTLDEQFAEVGTMVPGFAGTYVDEALGRLLVLSTRPSPSTARAAQRAILEVLGDRSLAGLQPVALPARYSFARLKAWHDRVTVDVLGIPGVVLTDVDEVRNRLRVGIAPHSGLGVLIASRVSALGIPAAAVLIEETKPYRFASSLRDKHRPVVGGLQISRPDGGLCTLGFNAGRAGVNGFITNSHCTTTQGGVESTNFWQPTKLITNKIGVETVDPLYRTGGSCPAGKRCRYSDAAFAKYDSGVNQTRGMVAMPALNSYAWNGTDKARVTRETTPLIGQSIAKVGRTTGKSIGTVTSQCVNINQLGTNVLMLCQSVAGTGAQPGDSGSPIVRSEGGAANDVSLKGILWGGDGSTIAFSAIGNIVRTDELGSVDTCASGFSC